MEVVYFSNEFPKEDLGDIFRQLHLRSKDSGHHVLARFIEEASKAVKNEVQKLPLNLRQLIPHFETVSAWSENKELREGLLCGAVDGALLVFAQLSLYIW